MNIKKNLGYISLVISIFIYLSFYYSILKINEWSQSSIISFSSFLFITVISLIAFITIFGHFKEIRKSLFIGNKSNFYIFRNNFRVLRYSLLNLLMWTLLASSILISSREDILIGIGLLIISVLLTFYYNWIDTDFILIDRNIYTSRLFSPSKLSQIKEEELLKDKKYSKSTALKNKWKSLAIIILTPCVLYLALVTYRTLNTPSKPKEDPMLKYIQ